MRSKLRALFVCTAVIMAWSGPGIVAAPPVQRSFAAGSFVLELDGVQVGHVSGVEGGLPFGDVIKEATEDYFFKKHLGYPGYRDIRLEIGPGLDKSLYNWIGLTLQGQPEKKNGAILTVDFQGTVRRRLEFTRAQITEVSIPAADGGSRDPVRILIGLTPEQTSLNKSVGGSAKVSGRQQTALARNFRLQIDGVNVTRVSKVEALTVKIPLMSSGEGECYSCEGIPAPAPARMDVSNVIMTLSETGSESVADWFDKFVIQGQNEDSDEKDGALEFLAPDLQTPLFTIKFKHLGIFELMPVMGDATQNSIPRLVAAMYCEAIQFAGQ